MNPRPHGPEPCALPTALHPGKRIPGGRKPDQKTFFIIRVLSSIVKSKCQEMHDIVYKKVDTFSFPDIEGRRFFGLRRSASRADRPSAILSGRLSGSWNRQGTLSVRGSVTNGGGCGARTMWSTNSRRHLAGKPVFASVV